MLQKFHKNQKGFTLIELLVVIAIIGILAAVAIPQFASYRRNAYCSRVESDVNNVMLSLEAYYAANNVYSDILDDLKVAKSDGVDIAITLTEPVTVVGTDLQPDGTDCPKGNIYTLAQGATPGWK
jgi:prepilin-type N-terminal cleavage/methylation domain-containing protein